MEAIFKDYLYVYCEDIVQIVKSSIRGYEGDLSNVKHLKDVEPLYHYRHIDDDTYYPVYYETDDIFLTKITSPSVYYDFIYVDSDLVKDHTLVNIKNINKL